MSSVHKMILSSMGKTHIQINFLMLQDLTNISRKVMVKQYFLGEYIWIMFKQSTQDRHIVFYKCWETSEAYSVFSFPLLVLFLTRLFSLISNLLF